uniref:Uncharacterized protein n=1 Tax=Brassica oleracea var. oleracea TaxID=109376 RepID=A0A0D3AK00_BRAOL
MIVLDSRDSSRSPPGSYIFPNELGQTRSTFPELFSLDDPKSPIDDKAVGFAGYKDVCTRPPCLRLQGAEISALGRGFAEELGLHFSSAMNSVRSMSRSDLIGLWLLGAIWAFGLLPLSGFGLLSLLSLETETTKDQRTGHHVGHRKRSSVSDVGIPHVNFSVAGI